MLASRTLALQATKASAPQGVRTMATLRELELRLKSVRNIEKITKSMKMIASTKLTQAQRAMVNAKQYGLSNKEVFAHTKPEEEAKRKLFLVISSDRGLCGGIHSSVSKATRKILGNTKATAAELETLPKAAPDSPVMIIGDKSRSQLQRAVPKNIALTFNQIGKDVPTFADACAVADLVTTSGVDFDSVIVVYNKFVSALSYEAAFVEVQTEKILKDAPGFKSYEMEDDATKDLVEFSLANAIFAALVESHAAEQSSRRNAMDNASKNAGDMITSLQMKYNRGRQAAITNELVDIITGASAL